MTARQSIIAFAGRRVDPPGAPYRRFPPQMISHVKQQLLSCFSKLRPSRLVCAAAAGADLLALSAAEELRIPYTLILPTSEKTFREKSVADRPGQWVVLYDAAVRRAKELDTFHTLQLPASAISYLRGNESILDGALACAGDASSVIAVAAWDGRAHDDDITAAFLASARSRGFVTQELSTLS
ncbi:MAG TPA: hypothetical protein VGG59_05425 [Acidobacteriaceae bacterium]